MCCCVLEYELQHVVECHAASEETNNELKGATCLLFCLHNCSVCFVMYIATLASQEDTLQSLREKETQLELTIKVSICVCKYIHTYCT